MIHLIENQPAVRNQSLLMSMFADRKRLFVDLFGWDVPVVDGQYEIEQFDTAEAVYLVIADDQGDHAASLRLLPTCRPHMIDTLFPDLCPGGIESGETTWESTRLCLPQRHGAEQRCVLRNRLISAMVDFALERGIERYTGVLPEAFRKEVLAMGWRGEPLGPAVRMPGGPVGAFMVHIDARTPARLGWTGTYSGKSQWVSA